MTFTCSFNPICAHTLLKQMHPFLQLQKIYCLTKHNFFWCNHLYINFLQRPLLCLWANLSKKSNLKINKTNFYNEEHKLLKVYQGTGQKKTENAPSKFCLSPKVPAFKTEQNSKQWESSIHSTPHPCIITHTYSQQRTRNCMNQNKNWGCTINLPSFP